MIFLQRYYPGFILSSIFKAVQVPWQDFLKRNKDKSMIDAPPRHRPLIDLDQARSSLSRALAPPSKPIMHMIKL